MKRILVLCLCLCILPLYACTPSPTAVTVGGRKVDASEYAFFLNSNRPDQEQALSAQEANLAAREAAIDQIASAEIVRLKCKDLGLSPSAAEEEAVAAAKTELVRALGGMAAYLDYLTTLGLTDRCYDKLQMNFVYYQLLYEYITEDTAQERYTDENMRRLFAENYIRVKYIKLNLVDDQGNPLTSAALNDQKHLAEYIYMELIRGEANFAEMLEGFGEDEAMENNREGIVLCPTDIGGAEYLLPAFAMEKGEYQLIEEALACYIITRADIPAGYYEENQTAIINRAKSDDFNQFIAQWKEETPVTTHRVIDKINLDNFMEYVK